MAKRTVRNRELEDFRFCMSALADDMPFMQSPSEINSHPAYLEIERMGMRAVDMIFRELKAGDPVWNFVYNMHRVGGQVPQRLTAHFIVLHQAFGQWRRNPQLHPVRNLCTGRI